MNLKQALAQLDPEDDDHWTADGLARMDAVMEIFGDDSVTRQDVTNADPSLNRDVAAERAAAEPEVEHEVFMGSGAGTESVAPHTEPPPAPAPVKMSDVAPGLHIPDAGVLSLPIPTVLSSPEYTDLALAEVSALTQDLLEKKKMIDEELGQLNAKNEILKRTQAVHIRNGERPNNADAIKTYLESQRLAREGRVKRAQAFIEAGTTRSDVIDALRVGSKLDSAMGQRKPARGSVRPSARATG